METNYYCNAWGEKKNTIKRKYNFTIYCITESYFSCIFMLNFEVLNPTILKGHNFWIIWSILIYNMFISYNFSRGMPGKYLEGDLVKHFYKKTFPSIKKLTLNEFFISSVKRRIYIKQWKHDFIMCQNLDDNQIIIMLRVTIQTTKLQFYYLRKSKK